MIMGQRCNLMDSRYWRITLPLVMMPMMGLMLPAAQAMPGPPSSVERAQLAQAAPLVPPRPQFVPDAIAPDPNGIINVTPDSETAIGIGHLRPTDVPQLELEPQDESSPTPAAWLMDIALPIYAEPAAEPWGWLINGWLIPKGGEPIAIGHDAAFSMLQTSDTLLTFPVMTRRSDGWFQFQYTPAGYAWAHIDHLALGDIELTIEPWSDHFLGSESVHYRNPGVSLPLRQAPNGNGSLVLLVGPNSHIQPLAIEGDWMRVRVTQPVEGCEPRPGARTEEGWMRWRDPEKRPRIWHSPTLCTYPSASASD